MGGAMGGAMGGGGNEGRPLLDISAVTKRFGSVAAVEELSLSVAENEFFAMEKE